MLCFVEYDNDVRRKTFLSISTDKRPSRQDSNAGHLFRLLEKKEQEVIKMMVAILVGFAITYLPSFIVVTVRVFRKYSKQTPLYAASFKIIMHQKIISPIIKKYYIFANSIYQADPHKKLPQLQITSYIILWASPIINPIIYIVMQQSYRVAFVALLEQIGLMKQSDFMNPDIPMR